VARRVSDEELLAGALHARIERWLEREGIFTILGFGDVELADEMDWEPGAGPVYLRRLDDGRVWRADITVTARPAAPGKQARGSGEQPTAVMVPGRIGCSRLRAVPAPGPSSPLAAHADAGL
jgi:hypothetical protein